MLINEDRLRELYAAGEIDLEQLERSLDIINARKSAAARRPRDSARASAPLTPDERSTMLDAAAAAPRPARRREARWYCPRCGSPLRVFRGDMSAADCEDCGAHVNLEPAPRVETEYASETFMVGGIVFPLDGGLFG